MGPNRQSTFAYTSDGFNTLASIGEGRRAASLGAIKAGSPGGGTPDAVFLADPENHEYKRLGGS